MPRSVVFTFHPEIQLLLQKQFQGADGSILPFKKWVEQTLSQKIPFRLFSEEEQRLCVKKLREGADSPAFDGIDDLALSLFKSLKDKQISENSFLKGVESSRLMPPKKKLLLGLARWYSVYVRRNVSSPKTLDEEDLYELAHSLSSDRFLGLDKAVVLALKLTSLELKLLRQLEEKGGVVEMISIDSFNSHSHSDILVVGAESLYLEVESVLKDISIQFESGARECLIYCFQSWSVYRQILSTVCKKRGLSLDSVTILPWEDNTVVLGEKGLVYLVGVSEEKSEGPFDLFSPEEKEHLNDCLKSDLFELPYERKERTRQLVRYLASCSRRLWVSYVGKCPMLLSEFLVECKVDAPALRAGASRDYTARSFRPEMSLRLNCAPFPPEMDLPSVYSVRSLSQYQRCPYGFFIRECLGVYPKPLKQDRLTAAEEGILYHDILFRFFSGGCQELAEVAQESFQVFTKKTGKNISLPQHLKMEKTVSLFLAKEKEWRKTGRFKPRYFEQSFEMELKQGDESIPIRGKIDRIDIDEERKEFIVIDYKTGGELPSAKEVMAGRDFQLVIYAIAMEELFLRGYRPSQGFCYHVKKAKSKSLFDFVSEGEWQALKKRTLNEVFSIVSEIRKKRFVGTPENCYDSCELRGMCAVNGRGTVLLY